MKIVQVTPRYPPHTGGVETHVKEISERFVERGHEVVVLTADAEPDVATRERRNGVVVKRHRGFAPGGAFHVAPRIAWSVRRERADVVHAHNYHSLPLMFAAVAAGRIPLVVTPHYHSRSADGVRDKLLSVYRPFGGWALRRAAVVAVSEWERARLRADFGVEATVVPNGLDVERFVNAVPDIREMPYVLYVGRLEEYKGVQHVIRGLQELDDYELIVAGTGPYRRELREIARHEGVDDRVEFLGYVDDDRLPGLYAGAAVYVTLSEFEAYGMTVGEALAGGTPCVVRDGGALGEWTSRPGCVPVKSTDRRTVAAAIRAAVETDPATADLPTWDDVESRISDIYRSHPGVA